jgi:ABC-type phosphate transport system permease subunit
MNIQKIAIGIFIMSLGFLILFTSGVYYVEDTISGFPAIVMAILGLLVMFMGMLKSFSGLDKNEIEKTEGKK